MPFLGAHVSTAGGVCSSLDRAEKIQCEAMQIFAKNNKCWLDRPMDEQEAARFRKGSSVFPKGFVVSHAGYLINLAAGDEDIHRKSVESMLDEMTRAESLGIRWVVLHPGSHGGRGEEWGIPRVIHSLQTVLDRTKSFKAGILIETTAGQGNALGWKFEHIAEIRRALKPSRRVGVCVDTCHIFAAGYELRTREGYDSTIRALDALIGIKNVKLFHLNDSLKGLGSRVDRHEHIGRGEIGLDGFRFLMNDRRFSNLPMVLETPKGPDMKEDVINLKTLKGLIRR